MAPDFLETFGYVVGFWCFIFSRKFRETWVGEWKCGGSAERIGKMYEAIVAILIGLAAPIGLLWLILWN